MPVVAPGSSGTSNTGTSAMIPPQPPPPAAIGRAPRSPPPALPARGLRDRVCLSERRAVVAASRRWAIASSAGLLFPGAGVGYLRWGRSPAGAAADGAAGNICLEHGLPVYLYQHSNGRRHPGPPPTAPRHLPCNPPLGEFYHNPSTLRHWPWPKPLS